MKKYKINFLSTLFVLIAISFQNFLYGQEKESIKIKTTLVDENDNPIPNALIVLGDGLVETNSNSNGSFTLDALLNNILLISANGYKSKVIQLNKEVIGEKIVLESASLFDDRENEIILPGNLKTTQRALTGAVSKVSGEELESQPDIVFHNALQGRLAGVTARMTTNGLGNNHPAIYVRGLGRESANTALFIVDGLERPIDFLNAEEIESVEVLKDASAKILYGSRAANGVILVTTKKGRKNTQVIKGSVEYGANMNTRMATYLNSADYATLYNEARENDGFSPLYSAADIEGYRNSTGENDLFYPNIDHNSYFLKESTAFRKMNFEYSGGTDKSQYGVYLGYIGNGGLEKIGEDVSQDRINIRGNLAFDLTNNLKAYIQGNGIIESRQWGKLGQDQVFGRVNSERPNEFPLVIQDPNFIGEAASLGEEIIPPLGGSFQNRTSLYGDMLYGGNQKYIFFHGQTDFGLDWDLNKTIKGLSASTKLNFDSYDYYATEQKNNPIRYVVEKDEDTGEATYTKLNNRSITAQVKEMGSASTRSLGSTTNVEYQTSIEGDDMLTLDLSHFYYLNQDNSRRQHIKNGNTVFKINYAYKNKLFFDLTHALMTSNKFAKGNRSFLSQAVGAAWVISEEDFFKGNAFDYLKLKSSYGVIGYDASTSFYLFETRYSSAGNVNFGERNTSSAGRISFNNFGNPDLAWERSNEFNVGVEGLAFNKSLQFEFNYFHELRDDVIYDNPTSNTTGTIGIAKEPLNMGKVANQGIDGSVNWRKNFGDFKLNVGGNFIISKNKIKQSDVIDNIDSNLNVIGTPSDAIFGYVANGIFKTQEEVDNAPFQALGQYGVGNVSYKDLNDDGVIDERDRKVIGNSFPRSNFGISLDAKYKGFGLSALGVVQTGVDMIKNNAYYRNSGEGKYSTLASDRFHPVNNPNGTEPILTTLTPINDNVTSTFWMENASFFRLKNVELSYAVSKDTWLVKKMKFYVRGTNLFVLSDVKDLDPEVPNSGVSNYPLFRTVTGGVSLSF
ncbi:SusC/RagA family TonB-linked outer membrane protein [Wenyingzhuangia sp. 2_MG-2023]|uniref:SusC/RagA family TonB-linked outer membrane protein n=1 Tax=Wenyingzhuangia sp. 2_MG-2023 TaxID=3062639 RepID=UPI0026E382BA|nr:SusC/RagA family TonB-linked outer membrane protein [Wenyingzhuangia sp. 2_MG-2023]MDO6737773.1 SusC/RagA family TonB-linked outer membrane protein [Wenyingzhuangia sp. 2_MG-2023]